MNMKNVITHITYMDIYIWNMHTSFVFYEVYKPDSPSYKSAPTTVPNSGCWVVWKELLH
jgi:hypothetical protein